jgi:hypothetical protein
MSKTTTPADERSAHAITLELLRQYRDFMSVTQLERYADYALHMVPEQPFSPEEIKELEQKKKEFLNKQ